MFSKDLNDDIFNLESLSNCYKMIIGSKKTNDMYKIIKLKKDKYGNYPSEKLIKDPKYSEAEVILHRLLRWIGYKKASLRYNLVREGKTNIQRFKNK